MFIASIIAKLLLLTWVGVNLNRNIKRDLKEGGEDYKIKIFASISVAVIWIAVFSIAGLFVLKNV